VDTRNEVGERGKRRVSTVVIAALLSFSDSDCSLKEASTDKGDHGGQASLVQPTDQPRLNLGHGRPVVLGSELSRR
jgi:hypothetical protein